VQFLFDCAEMAYLLSYQLNRRFNIKRISLNYLIKFERSNRSFKFNSSLQLYNLRYSIAQTQLLG